MLQYFIEHSVYFHNTHTYESVPMSSGVVMAVVAPEWITSLLGALMLAILVAMGVRWIRLPYTIALVLVGLLIGMLGPWFPAGEAFQGILSAEVILFLMLPPLLFQGAATMDLGKLMKNWKSISLLAIPGVLISSTVIGIISWKLIWPDEGYNGLMYGLLLGSILAATDPVSVLALFKKLGAPKRLTVLVEGESLFNDGTAVVLFNILLLAVLAEKAGVGLSTSELFISGIAQFFYVILVGLLVGLVGGVMSNWLLVRSQDHLVEISITVALAFGTFLLAELFHGSGVIAVVVGGLLVGNHGTRSGMTATARVGLHHFWEVATFLINGILFLLIGYELQNAFTFNQQTLLLGMTGIFAALIGRIVIYPLILLANLYESNPIPVGWRHTMYWAGLRGSIPIALLLLIANMTTHSTSFEIGGDVYGTTFPTDKYHDMLVMSFSVVLWTLIVQGLSLKPLMNVLGVGTKLHEKERSYEVALAETIGARTALLKLEEMHSKGLISELDMDRMWAIYQNRLVSAQESMLHFSDENKIHEQRIENARRELLLAQITTIREAEMGGLLSSSVANQAISALDEELHLSEEKEELQRSEPKESDIKLDDPDDLPPASFAKMLPPVAEEILDIEKIVEDE